MSNLKTINLDAVIVGTEVINDAYYKKIFCDIIVTIKDQYSMKKAAESVTMLSELSKAIYELHGVGNYTPNKNKHLKDKWDKVSSIVKRLQSSLKNIGGLDRILAVATSVKNAKA